MALRMAPNRKPETPYSRPPPLHVCVVAMKEQDKVLSWQFEDGGGARGSNSKKNTIAVLSDGESLAKITVFGAYASKISVGPGYMMRGYSLRGESPPYGIMITRDTVFFRSAPVQVSEALRLEGEKLLCPVSKETPLSEVRGAWGLLTVQGEVVEVS